MAFPLVLQPGGPTPPAGAPAALPPAPDPAALLVPLSDAPASPAPTSASSSGEGRLADVASSVEPIGSTLAFQRVITTPAPAEAPANETPAMQFHAWRVLVKSDRSPRRVLPRLLGAVAVLGILAAGAYLFEWRRSARQQAWRDQARAALRLTREARGDALLAALPALADAPDDAARELHALATGAGRLLRGQTEAGLAKLQEGRAALERVEDPELMARLQLLRGRAFLELGRTREAKQAIDVALDADPRDPAAARAAGDIALRSGELPAAIAHYEAAARLAPRDPTYTGLLGRCAELRLEQGDAAGALTSLERLRETRSDAVLEATIGDVLFALDRHADAREAYASARARSMGEAPPAAALLGLARLALLEGRPGEVPNLLAGVPPGPARRLLQAQRALVAGRPLDALALLDSAGDEAFVMARANAQLVLGDPAAALEELRGLPPARASWPRLLLAQRVRVRLALGEGVEAEAALEALREQRPKRATRPRLGLLGRRALRPADLAALDAILQGEVCLARFPLEPDTARAALAGAQDSALAAMVLGRVELRAEQPEAARDALRRAARLAPHDPEPQRGLGRLAVQAGALEEAHAAYSAALERDPRDPAARVARAELLLRLGRPSDAERDLLRCEGAVDPRRLAFLRGQCAAALGDPGAAAEQYRLALRHDPDDPRLLREAARALLAVGLRHDALRLYERLATEAAPGDPEVHRERARLLLEAGDPAGALESAERLGALLPDRPDGPVAQARALLALGRRAEAERALELGEARGESDEGLFVRLLLEIRGATAPTVKACTERATEMVERLGERDLARDLAAELVAVGTRHLEAQRGPAAQVAFQLALTRNARALPAHHGLLRILAARRRWRELSDAASRLLAEFPEDEEGKQAFDTARRHLRGS